MERVNVYRIRGKDAVQFIESLGPMDVQNSAINTAQYSVLLNEQNGGIIDDVIIGRDSEDTFELVSNAASAERVKQHLDAQKGEYQVTTSRNENALLAIQGMQISSPPPELIKNRPHSNREYHQGWKVEECC